MSTRGFVLIGEGNGSAYHVYYRHNDTYPRSLGVEIAKYLNQDTMNTAPTDIKLLEDELGLENTGKTIFDIDDCLELQGDIGWVYLIQLKTKKQLSEIWVYKTTVPRMTRPEDDFIFLVWSSYIISLGDVEPKMSNIEQMAEITLNAVAAYEAKKSNYGPSIKI